MIPIRDANEIREAVTDWQRLFAEGSTREGDRLVHPGVWAKFGPAPRPESSERPKWLADLGIVPGVNVAKLNIPHDDFDPNVLGAVARDALGRRWIIRQGRLHEQSKGDVRITDGIFARFCALEPIRIEGCSRPYYAVACIDGDTAQIPSDMSAFVSACSSVRRRVNAPNTPDLQQAIGEEEHLIKLLQLLESKETGAQRFISAREGRTLDVFHDHVKDCMAAIVREFGIEPRGARSNSGLEVDLLVPVGRKYLLFEIKTSAGASSIHTGVGQLLIYRYLFHEIGDIVPVLALPQVPPVFRPILDSLGIRTLEFGDPKTPAFGGTLREMCAGSL